MDHPKGAAQGLFRAVGNAVTSITLPKFNETDKWFDERRRQLDAFEKQLRALLRAIELMVRQRKELANAHGALAKSMFSLAQFDLGPSLNEELTSMGALQTQMRDIQDRQAVLDMRTLEDTVNEYVRIAGSIRVSRQPIVYAFNISGLFIETHLDCIFDT
jgi:sorting nexin-1/2